MYPNEVTHFKKRNFETIKMNDMVIGRVTYEPTSNEPITINQSIRHKRIANQLQSQEQLRNKSQQTYA